MVKNIYENQEFPSSISPSCPIEKKLKGQTAIVTGASSGIGKAIAIALGQAGANVVINYFNNKEIINEIVLEIERCGSNAIGFRADVAKEEDVIEMFDVARKEYGVIDILINNAALQQDAAFDEMTLAQWQRVIDINLTGQFLCAREAVREFKKRGVREEVSCSAGKIICISSVHEVIPWAGHVNYAASKGKGLPRRRRVKLRYKSFEEHMESAGLGQVSKKY